MVMIFTPRKMNFKFSAIILTIFLSFLLVETNGLGTTENSASFQPLLFRRNPDLTVESEGIGSGNGGGRSSTNLKMTGNPNGNSMNGLNIQSNAYGSGSGGGSSSTSLNFNNGNGGGLSVDSHAVGVGGGPDNSVGGISSTSLQLNNGDDGNDNQELSVNSNAIGVGDGNGGVGASQTSLNLTNQPNGDNDNLDIQSSATGMGSGPNGVGGGMTSLHTKDNETGETLDVESIGVGAGENGGIGASSTSLNSSGPNDNDTKVDSTALGAGNGDNAIGVTNTKLKTTDDNGTLETETTGVGIGSGDQSTGLATSSIQAKDNGDDETINVNSTGVGNGDEQAVGLTNTSLEQTDSDGKVTKVDTTSVGQAEGGDSLGASQTSLEVEKDTKNVDQQPDSVVPVQNGQNGLSTNGLHIDDDEGDIDIGTAALGSGTNGGTGASKIGLQMEDASSKGLKVKTTSEGIGDSSQGIGGSSTTVLVDDQTNERSVDARSIGIGFDNDEGSGGFTADSVKYHDTDKEHEEVVDTSNGGVSKTITDETSNLDIHNDSSDYHIVRDDGTTTRSTKSSSSTRSTQTSTTQKQSFYTTQVPIIQGQDQDFIVTGEVGEDQTQDYSLTDYESQQLVNQEENHIVSNHETQETTNYDQNTFISNQEISQQDINQDQDYILSNQGGQQTINYNQDTLISNQQSSQQIENEDQEYILSNQGSQQVTNHSRDTFVSNQQSSQQITNENQDYILSNEGSQQVMNHSQDSFVSSQQSSQQIINEDQNYITSNQGNQQVVKQKQGTFQSNQQNSQQIINHDQDYIVSNQEGQHIVNEERNSFVSNQQDQQDYVIPTQQNQNSNQIPPQQPTIGSRDVDTPTPVIQHSSLLCPDTNRGPGVVCYYQVSSLFEYADGFVLRPDSIFTEYCDVLVLSYAILDIDNMQIGAFSPDEENIFGELVKLKNENLKIILQLQYVAFYEEYARILHCGKHTNQFISSVMDYLRQWNFDGIELPLMVPQPNTDIYATAPIIKQKYAQMVQNLKAQLQQENLLLSICLPNDPDLIDMVYDIPHIVDYVDWFSVNTIDYNGPDQGVLQCASPLTPQNLDDPFCIDYTVNSLIDQRGVPTDKVVINVPLYGSTYMLQNYKEKAYKAKVTGRGPSGPSSNTEGFLTISELCSLRKINWLNSPAIVTDYDDVPTLVLKVTYARSKCLGGVAIHAITMDDPTGHLCGCGAMPFTRAISIAYNPKRPAVRNEYEDEDDLVLVNYIDKRTTNKYEL